MRLTVDAHILAQYPSIADQCIIEVSLDPGTEVSTARWFDIWAAGVVIQTTCIQHGLNGIVSYLGEQSSPVLDNLKESHAKELKVKRRISIQIY